MENLSHQDNSIRAFRWSSKRAWGNITVAGIERDVEPYDGDSGVLGAIKLPFLERSETNSLALATPTIHGVFPARELVKCTLSYPPLNIPPVS